MYGGMIIEITGKKIGGEGDAGVPPFARRTADTDLWPHARQRDEVIGEMLTLTVVRLPAAQRVVLAPEGTANRTALWSRSVGRSWIS